MSRLTRRDLKRRLALDYNVLQNTSTDGLGDIRGFASRTAMRGGDDLTVRAAKSTPPELYAIEFRYPHLAGPGRTTSSSVVIFDLLAGGNYPITAPQVWFVTQPRPWSPHVHQANGLVCLGDGWKYARGKMLAVHLVVHVMRLVNFDEPDLGGSHFNPAAARYWRKQLGGRPYLPDLVYPRLPSGLTHGANDDRDDCFGLAKPLFRSANARETDSTDFRPVGEVARSIFKKAGSS